MAEPEKPLGVRVDERVDDAVQIIADIADAVRPVAAALAGVAAAVADLPEKLGDVIAAHAVRIRSAIAGDNDEN